MLTIPQFSHRNGKLTLLDDYGNEYEMVQLPKSIEQYGKGGASSSMSPPRASLVGVPPGFEKAKTLDTQHHHIPMQAITKIVEKRTDPMRQHSHIKITLVSEKTIVFVSANVNPKRNQSTVSYEVWEALGKPILMPLEQEDKECMGSVILKIRNTTAAYVLYFSCC